MKPDHIICLSLKKRPMTAAERARRYRERRKLKLLGVSTNLLEQALNASTGSILPEEMTNGGNESWSKDPSEYQSDMDADNTICSNQEKEILETPKNSGIVIKIEPGLSDIIHQANLSHSVKDYIEGCNRLKKNDQKLHVSTVDINNSTFCQQEDKNNLNSKNTSIDIKIEPGLTDYNSQDDVSQDDLTKYSNPKCSHLEEDHSSVNKFLSSVEEFSDNETTVKKGAKKQENYPINKCDEQQQTNEIPIATLAEKQMIKWNDDKPTTKPVLNEVFSKRPMTAAERKRKSRAKQRAEAKSLHQKQEKCSCGTNLKTRDKLKAEVDTLTQRKELLSAKITLLQTQPQQVKLGFIENDSEDDLSNVSTNDSSTECSRSKDVSFVDQTKTKRAISVNKGHEVNCDSITRMPFFTINGMLDDYQVFGEFVTRELRNLRSDLSRRRLKRMIQKVIIEVSESEDR